MRTFKCILILILIDYSCFSQNNFQLPDSNAIWRISWGTSDCMQNNWFADYQYFISGDTNINASNYHKITRSGSFLCPPPNFPQKGYMGAFRNSINDKKVYIIPADSTEEIILYDINLNVGDTISGYLRQISNNISITDSIDSLFVGTEFKRRWHYSSKNGFIGGSIIDGIGCDQGLLEGLMAHMDNNGSLFCFSVNDQTLYPSFDTIPCALASSINEIYRINEDSIFCYPNPANDYVNVKANCHLKIKSYILYNMPGEIILNIDFHGKQMPVF